MMYIKIWITIGICFYLYMIAYRSFTGDFSFKKLSIWEMIAYWTPGILLGPITVIISLFKNKHDKSALGAIIIFIAFTIAFLHISEILCAILAFIGSGLFFRDLLDKRV